MVGRTLMLWDTELLVIKDILEEIFFKFFFSRYFGFLLCKFWKWWVCQDKYEILL